jgi:hypothetical protein
VRSRGLWLWVMAASWSICVQTLIFEIMGGTLLTKPAQRRTIFQAAIAHGRLLAFLATHTRHCAPRYLWRDGTDTLGLIGQEV